VYQENSGEADALQTGDGGNVKGKEEREAKGTPKWGRPHAGVKGVKNRGLRREVGSKRETGKGRE